MRRGGNGKGQLRARRRLALAAVALTAWTVAMGIASDARGIVSSNAGTSVFNGVNINALVGAETFYFSTGTVYDGSRAVVANVEAGHIWNGHETLGHVQTYINDPSIEGSERQFDWHATMVGQTIGGRGMLYGFEFGDFKTAAWYGIAPGAELWSTSIASQFNPEPGSDFSGSFEITRQSFVYGYKTTMLDGVNGRRADVINSSWGYDDAAGNVEETVIIDAMAYAGKQTVVLAAGNHDTGNPAVGGAASGYNSIGVAALTGDTLPQPYGAVAPFSNRGLNDFYNAKTGTTATMSRVAVDLAAPGDNLTLAFYGGLTGGHTSGTDPVNGSGQFYVQDMGGTSFASPIVAGGAALVVDVGYDRFGGGNSIDGRVVKAVLMNSATKLAGWDNGEENIGGVVRTNKALDEATGAGMMNLAKAFRQYTAGTTDVAGLSGGDVQPVGWDFGRSVAGEDNDYVITAELLGGSVFSATLDWFVNRQYDDVLQTAADVQFADLDLEIWKIVGGLPSELIATSESPCNNVEHLYFELPETGFYMVRVKWFGEVYDVPGDTEDAEEYGLAWEGVVVPEPSTGLLLVACGLLVRRRRRGFASVRVCGG